MAKAPNHRFQRAAGFAVCTLKRGAVRGQDTVKSFKRFKDILEPDPVQRGIVLWDSATGKTKPLSLQAIYRRVQAVTLHRGVPLDIRRHFQQAKNLLVYSWFVFAFTMSAQLHAYITIELALRRRLGPTKAPFRALLAEAVNQKLISAKGFASLAGLRTERVFSAGPEIFDEIDILVDTSKTEEEYQRALMDVLSRAIPALRNQLAHGFTETHNGGFLSVELAADLINQLFDAE